MYKRKQASPSSSQMLLSSLVLGATPTQTQDMPMPTGKMESNSGNSGNSGNTGSSNGPNYFQPSPQDMYKDDWYNQTAPVISNRPTTNAPVSQHVEVRVSRGLSIGGGDSGGMTIDVAEIIIDFDQELFIDDFLNRVSIDLMSEQEIYSAYGQTSSTPKSVLYSKNLLKLQCGDKTWYPNTYDSPQANGPDFSTVYVTASVTSPFSTFLMAMNGVPLQEPTIKNRVAILMPLQVNYPPEMIQKMGANAPPKMPEPDFASCQVIFNSPNSQFTAPPPQQQSSSPRVSKRWVNLQHFLTNSLGVPIVAPVQLTAGKEPQCTYDDLLVFYNMATNIIDTFSKKDLNMQDFNQIPSIFNGLQSNIAYNACMKKAQSLFIPEQDKMQITVGAYCQLSYDDPEFQKDPCCNQQLPLCCAPRSQFVSYMAVKQFNDQNMASCSDKDKVQGLIYSVLESMRKLQSQSQSNNIQSEYTKYTDFFNTCQDKVYNTQCKTNADCLSGYCTDQKMCMVPWGQDTGLLLSCYLDNMPSNLFYQIKSDLSLPFSNNVTDKDLQLIKTSINDQLSEYDCVGNTAWQSGGNKQCSWQPDSSGYYKETCQPANQEKCLAHKQCNAQPWQDTTQQQCNTIAKKQPNICSRCEGGDNGWCYPISRPSSCQIYVGDDVEGCTLSGGSVTVYNYTYSTWTSCDFPDAKTELQCLGNLGGKGYYGTFAYTSDNQTACDTRMQTRYQQNDASLPYFYFNTFAGEKGLCMVYYGDIMDYSKYTSNIIKRAQRDGFNYYVQKQFTPGYLDNEADCKNGYCDNWNVQTTNKTECEASGYCNRGCKKCQSSANYNQQSACLISANSTVCDSQNGNLYNSNQCVLSVSEDVCARQQGKMITCDTLSEDKCNANGIYTTLKCYWNQWTNCENQDSCESTGECSDYEFTPQCQWNGNSCTEETNGVCLMPFQYMNNGTNQYCPQNQGWSQLGCIDQQSTKSQCTGKWKQRAKNAQECAAHGSGCYERNRYGFSKKGVEECQKCHGEMKSFYSWYGGVWKKGQMKPGKYEPTQLKSDNQWLKVVSRDRLQQTIQNSVGAIIGKELINTYKQSFLVPLGAIKQVACSCANSGSTANCFDATVIPQKSCRADPGQTNGCDVQLPSSQDSSVGVDIGLVSSGSFSQQSPSNKFRLSKRLTSSSYAVIKSNGQTVGQLIGDGKSFSFDKPVSAFTGCLDVSPTIPQDGKYTVYDAVKLNNNQLSAPLNIKMTFNGLQICGDFTQTGTYFPIIKLTSGSNQLVDTPASSTVANNGNGQTASTSSIEPAARNL
eukprot:NODE_112_length_18534_cov_1.163656.p1 type:complete len:1296 gc:universal NODE_112_length_18534_cov_1.163656:18410-14523(-)